LATSLTLTLATVHVVTVEAAMLTLTAVVAVMTALVLLRRGTAAERHGTAGGMMETLVKTAASAAVSN